MFTKADMLLLLWLSLKWVVDLITLWLGIGFILIFWIKLKLVIDLASIVYIVWRLTHSNHNSELCKTVVLKGNSYEFIKHLRREDA